MKKYYLTYVKFVKDDFTPALRFLSITWTKPEIEEYPGMLMADAKQVAEVLLDPEPMGDIVFDKPQMVDLETVTNFMSERSINGIGVFFSKFYWPGLTQFHEKKEQKMASQLMSKMSSWEDFRASGLLRFVNMFLHIFGWAIVLNVFDDGSIEAEPRRVQYDGFCENEERAYYKLGAFLSKDKFFRDNNDRRAAENESK